ncbi:hypothetical protein ABEX53_19070 [Bacillus toyonensis]|uniref:hypothetical protein n=1 Tax=Bacillus toyonensis TaxID=155322 RepID=UPI000CD7F9AA|nr:hypothetical protein [Bacillus toyonensis]MED3542301.1 hypothetical protein [Bacillus toyonensis]MEE2020834.1 hypothetical protein [Bacillus toyonensis]
MIQNIWLYPPLAFARLGSSNIACDSYLWGPNDNHPRGTGMTTIKPTETLNVASDGTISSSIPDNVTFKDSEGFRPVCPFFELHGSWITENGTVETGPITTRILNMFNFQLEDLKWKVEVANLKAYHYTLQRGDIISCTMESKGTDTEKKLLRAVSPANADQPLINENSPITLGSFQLTRPTEEFPEVRLRFTPAQGCVYGPTDLKKRITSEHLKEQSEWKYFNLPSEHLILNPNAHWCKFELHEQQDDLRVNPSFLLAYTEEENETGTYAKSLGLIDDVCDGVISCTLKEDLTAHARIVSTPPDYAPDRRPFVSLADGLTNRVSSSMKEIDNLVENMELTGLEIADLFERIYETMSLSNLDAQNDRANRTNQSIAQTFGQPAEEGLNKAFSFMNESILAFPLTESGRQHHRRFVSLEVLEDMFRENPNLIQDFIRNPISNNPYYDRKMPALMRGSDGYPMHLTVRQYALLIAWAKKLSEGAEKGT